MAEGVNIRMRAAEESDWPAILQMADQALPHSKPENKAWLHRRQTFNIERFLRRHYIAESEENGQVLAYGCIEEGPEAEKFRVFVVMAPDRLASLGQKVYDRLLEDLREVQAQSLWVREEADDPVLGLFRQQGFQQTAQFQIPNGREIVVLEMPFNTTG